ncbi:hypothetical protein PZ892_08170 [Sphingobacterium sp. WM]|uniref:DUF7674 family protein n=1 Tax=Sphingobacterium sp. WM TaxID=3031802 RepID=UPI00240DB6A3|nr:hypothetical protein [Sphingobacterium sp. WM]WFB65182.1 hypothetical protein PZ892_08170 [Sphingobacterium sp. WM]
MESKIISTVKAWLPQCVMEDKVESEYEVLQHVAEFCLANFEGTTDEQQMAREAIHVIGILYGGGSLHVKNAIENEFLERMASSESPASLRKHLTFFPKEMRPVYVKTIIEN